MDISHLRIASLVAAVTFAAGSSALSAADDQAPTVTGTAAFEANAPKAGARQPELLSFNYRVFFRRSTQLGLLSQDLGYTLTVAPDGKITDCSIDREFRSPNTARELCRTIKRVAEVSPALDEDGNATSGTYQGEIKIWSPFAASR